MSTQRRSLPQRGRNKRYDYSKYHGGQERPQVFDSVYYSIMEQRRKIAAQNERAGIHS